MTGFKRGPVTGFKTGPVTGFKTGRGSFCFFLKLNIFYSFFHSFHDESASSFSANLFSWRRSFRFCSFHHRHHPGRRQNNVQWNRAALSRTEFRNWNILDYHELADASFADFFCCHELEISNVFCQIRIEHYFWQCRILRLVRISKIARKISLKKGI